MTTPRRAPRGLRVLPVLGPALRSWPAPAPGSAWRDPVTGRSRRWCSARTSSSRCSGCCSSRPAPMTWASTPSTSSSCPSCTPPSSTCSAPGFNLLGNHFQVALAVLAPFFRVFPSPATLLFFQALVDGRVGLPRGGGRVRFHRAEHRPADRVRLRLLLGPAADDRLRLPRDRPRRAAARVLCLRAGPPPPGRGDRVGGAAGVREGGPGLHRGRDRRAARGDRGVPAGSSRPWDGATPGSRCGAGCSSWRGGCSGRRSRSS